VDDQPFRGRPVPSRAGLAPPSIESVILAAGGPPRFAERLAEIDRLTREAAAEAAELRRALERIYGAGSPLARARLRRELGNLGLSRVNDLIERHNRYYPIERRLPMDPLTGDFVPVAGGSYRREALDASTLLESVWPTGGSGPSGGRSPARRAAAAPVTPAMPHPMA
jgi:hypothetical protein